MTQVTTTMDWTTMINKLCYIREQPDIRAIFIRTNDSECAYLQLFNYHILRENYHLLREIIHKHYLFMEKVDFYKTLFIYEYKVVKSY